MRDDEPAPWFAYRAVHSPAWRHVEGLIVRDPDRRGVVPEAVEDAMHERLPRC